MDEFAVKIMENEDVKNALLKLSIPAVISMLITSIYNIIDTFFISAIGVTSITAAVSVVFPLFLLIGAVGLAFGVGGGTYVSRILGAKRKTEADIINSTAIFITLGLSVIVTILGLLFLTPILRVFGASDSVLPYAIAYSRILVLGCIFTMGNMALDCLIRAEGGAKYSMTVTLIGVILNTILNPVFIFSLKLGLEGSAYATVLAQSISFFLYLYYHIRNKSYVKLSVKLFKPSLSFFSETLKIGTPVFLKQFLICFSAGMINVAASRYGDSAVAAMGITMRVTSMFLMVIIGFTAGFQPIAAFSYGAKQFDRLFKAIKISILWLTVFSAFGAVFLGIFAGNIVGLFSRDQNVITAGVSLYRAFALTLPLMGFIYVFGSLFEALGLGKYAFLQAISRQGVFFVPSLLVLQSVFGFKGIVATQPLADILTGIFTAVLAITLGVKLKHMANNCPDARNMHIPSGRTDVIREVQ